MSFVSSGFASSEVILWFVCGLLGGYLWFTAVADSAVPSSCSAHPSVLEVKLRVSYPGDSVGLVGNLGLVCKVASSSVRDTSDKRDMRSCHVVKVLLEDSCPRGRACWLGGRGRLVVGLRQALLVFVGLTASVLQHMQCL